MDPSLIAHYKQSALSGLYNLGCRVGSAGGIVTAGVQAIPPDGFCANMVIDRNRGQEES